MRHTFRSRFITANAEEQIGCSEPRLAERLVFVYILLCKYNFGCGRVPTSHAAICSGCTPILS